MRKIGCIIFAVIFLCIGGYIYFNYFFVFSDGNREGLLNKFSTKGIAYKTNEGEMLMPGVVPTMNQLSNNFFYFSVEDPAVVEALLNATGKKIKVHYKQYRGQLPWRGNDYSDKNSEPGQYIVDAAEVVN